MKRRHDRQRVTPVLVKLDADQSEALRFIQGQLPVRPPLAGLVRSAVDLLLDQVYDQHPHIRLAWAQRRTHLRLEP